MKKIVVLLLSACMLLGVFAVGASAASDNQGKSYYAPYGVPTVDGIRDAAWDAATWAYISIGADSNKASVRFKVMHDGNLIYFLAESDDAAVNAALSECVHVSLHTHSCSNPDTCQDFVTEFMRYNGEIWHKQLAQISSNANYKVRATQSLYA